MGFDPRRLVPRRMAGSVSFLEPFGEPQVDEALPAGLGFDLLVYLRSQGDPPAPLGTSLEVGLPRLVPEVGQAVGVPELADLLGALRSGDAGQPCSLRACSKITSCFRIPSSGHLWPGLNREILKIGPAIPAFSLNRARPNLTQIWARNSGIYF